MKINVKRTVLIGFAFLSICAFWQMYNSVMPLILTNTFKLNETFSGVIMSADNVLALFLLPFFGNLSDRCTTKIGKRKPFILVGTVCSVVLMIIIPVLDNRYFANPSETIKVIFIVVLGCLLIFMGTYRSPAVALMPDVTPKPLRSKGNAIINLMGALGGIIYLIVAAVLYSSSKTSGLEHVDYLPLFMIVAGVMVVSLIIIMFAIDEVKLNRQMLEYEKEHPEENISEENEDGVEVISKDVKRSLIFLLCSIALWFMGYNAIETWFTMFANQTWNMSLGGASTCLTIATGGAILSYIPAGIMAGKIGRRKTITGAVLLLAACFMACYVCTRIFDSFNPVLYVVFLVIGLSWAFINVNSLPMVLEMCKGSEVGKFTGYYYTFSMSAQIVTPILCGTLLNRVGYHTLFPYCTAFIFASFITMLFVRHGDSKVEVKKGIEAFDVDD